MEEVSQVIIDFEKMQEDPDTLQMFMFGMFWVKVSNLTSKEVQKGLTVTLNESNSVRLTDKVKAFFTDIILGTIVKDLELPLQGSVSNALKQLYLYLCRLPRIFAFLDSVEIVRVASATRYTFIRSLISDPVENVTFEVFDADVTISPKFSIKVDVSSRIVKRRDGTRLLGNTAESKLYREDFAKYLKATLG